VLIVPLDLVTNGMLPRSDGKNKPQNRPHDSFINWPPGWPTKKTSVFRRTL